MAITLKTFGLSVLVGACLGAPVAMADDWKDESGTDRDWRRMEVRDGDRRAEHRERLDDAWRERREYEEEAWAERREREREAREWADERNWRRDEDDHYGVDYGPRVIPPGHYPPPGECRIWYPERPPGHQPPPADCDVLFGDVPTGAMLVQNIGGGLRVIVD